MSKKSLLALLLALTLLMSSCALVVRNDKVDAATPIVTVGDTVYTKAQVKTYVENQLSYMSSLYKQYGYSYDVTKESNIKQAQQTVVDNLVEQAVKDQKAVALGVTVTDEEMAKLDEEYQSMYDMIAPMVGSPSDLGIAEDQYNDYLDYVLTNYFGMSGKSTALAELKESKLKAEAVKDVTVTDEQITAAYDKAVEDAKTKYESSLSAYGEAVNNGETVYYRPAGYRMVRNLLIKLNSADSTLISALESKVKAQDTTMNGITVEGSEDLLAMITATVTETTAEGDTTPSFTAESTDTLPATEDADTLALYENLRKYAQAKALKDAYNEKLTAATAAAFAAIDEEADAVLARINGSADEFVAVLNEYNAAEKGDYSGMTAHPEGYAVCENFANFDTAFTTAAMAMTTVGEVSGKIAGSYGYYILQYASDVTEGAVPQADVQETVAATALTTAQDEAYTAAVQQWITDAHAVIDLDSLNK